MSQRLYNISHILSHYVLYMYNSCCCQWGKPHHAAMNATHAHIYSPDFNKITSLPQTHLSCYVPS